MDACLSDNLDDISVNLRKVLNVKEDRILFPNDVKIIIDKINNNLECYEVKYGTINDLKLINNCYVIIISNDQSEDEQFYYLLNALCYSLLIDKKTFNLCEINEYDVLYDEYSNYLRDAFLMPRSLYIRELASNSLNDGTIYIDKLEKKFKNKYVYKRGKDLKLF